MILRWMECMAVLAALAMVLARVADAKPDDHNDPGPAHLVAAQRLGDEIHSRDNEYAHKDCFIRWKGEEGGQEYANRSDCSDFFNLVLEHVYNFKKLRFKEWTGFERPTAAEWYDSVITHRS